MVDVCFCFVLSCLNATREEPGKIQGCRKYTNILREMERINVVERMKSSKNREFGLKHEKGHIMVCGTEGRRTDKGMFMRKTIFKEVHI